MILFSQPLPIDSLLPDVVTALDSATALVLTAAPGAGKTTRVPLALLDAPWLQGRKIILQEPRRIAARAAARRMAETLGESVGGTIGYRVRLDARVGPKTRVEVVTDGILLRMLQDDPGLPGVGVVLLDEFHERGLDSDLSLALLRDAQQGLRDDLRLLVMSATLATSPIAHLLGGAPVLASEGRAYPVETRHRDRKPGERTEDAVVETVRRALREDSGSLLVFLPGVGEIRRVHAALLDGGLPDGVQISPLYGDLPAAEQDRAILPAPAGHRKIVLATAIAETSLTIEGVRIVVDSGLMRVPAFDPATGMSRLVTRRVSLDAADQRRGRAGRTEPGVCHRLWPEAETRALDPHRVPEILSADLAELALQLATWGARVEDLSWLDPPPAASLAQARELLLRLGALDADGRPTAAGREMARLGLHPRLAHMLLRGRDMGCLPTAASLAALLGERDLFRTGATGAPRSADLVERLQALDGEAAPGANLDRGAVARVRELARSYMDRLGHRPRDRAPFDLSSVGRLVIAAYPDRIAARRGPPGEFRLASGRAAVLPPFDPLAAELYLAVADLDGAAERARIFRAARLTRAEIDADFGHLIQTDGEIAWSPRDRAVIARRRTRIDRLVLDEKPLASPDPGRVAAALLEGIRGEGLRVLPWTRDAEALRARTAFLRRLDAAAWPDWSDAALLASLEDWLLPYLAGCSRLDHLGRLDLAEILLARLDWPARQRLDRLAPTHLEVPSGSRLPIDYGADGGPSLEVRLQELFGLVETPRLADGQAALTLVLLSPARRPVQVTQDLRSFWATGYAQVKAELRGRYPKHHWPDDPLTAVATARTKPRA